MQHQRGTAKIADVRALHRILRLFRLCDGLRVLVDSLLLRCESLP